MRLALVISLSWVVILKGGVASAQRDAALHHPAVQEILLMMKGGVDYNVMVERVRRMEDVPTLDRTVIEALRRQDVPDKVLVELARRKPAVTPCAIPERESDVREVLDDPAIRDILRAVDSDEPTDAIIARVRRLPAVPVLDARALCRLTSKGVPDRALLELVRKQEIRTGCDAARAELLAAADDAARKQKEAVTRKNAEAELERTEAAASDMAIARWDQTAEEKPHSPSRRADVPIEPAGMGRIVVIARSPLPVAYLEVFVDGDSVIHKGAIEEGETKPGWMLPPPPLINIRRGEVVYESELPVGAHRVNVAFAMSRIAQTHWDDVVEAYGQRYETTRVGPLDLYGMQPNCEVSEGRSCVVLARIVKRGEFYAVVYETKTGK